MKQKHTFSSRDRLENVKENARKWRKMSKNIQSTQWQTHLSWGCCCGDSLAMTLKVRMGVGKGPRVDKERDDPDLGCREVRK